MADRVGARGLTRCVVCSECDRNNFTGTIGSWIGSMAKLTWL
jgi:hypothetical protein